MRKQVMVTEKPHMMKFWDHEKNTLDPAQTPAKSAEKAFWKCPKCGYEWEATIRTRKNDLCPCCDQGNKIGRGINDFLTLVPELGKDYKQELNPDIDPGTLGVGSHVRIKWACHLCGHEWMAPIYRRIRNNEDGTVSIGKCPVCAGNKRALTFDEEYPELVPMFSENNKISLSEVKGTDYQTEFLWKCEKHGEFKAVLSSILRAIKTGNTGCPYCHGTKVKYEDSFAVKHPDLMKEWSIDNTVSPYEIGEGSNYEAIWECDHGHRWTATVRTRVSGYGFCRDCHPFGIVRDGIAGKYPELKAQYSDKNETPFEMLSTTDTRGYLWVCDNGHEFLASPENINQAGHLVCPVCNFREIRAGVNDFATLYGDLAYMYDTAKNDLPITAVSPVSTEPVHWKCDEGHCFTRSPRNHIKWAGSCPICNRKTLSVGENDLLTKYPKIQKIWDYERNGKRPEDCFESSSPYYYFICDKHHSYYTQVKTVVDSDFNCPVCSGDILQVGVNSLVDTHRDLAEEWGKSNEKGPENYMKHSGMIVKWECPVCHSEYQAAIRDREVGDDRCPYCKSVRVKPGVNDIETLDPKLAREWSEQNEKPASEVLRTFTDKVFWDCPVCHNTYKASPAERKVGDDACPYCRNEKVSPGFNDFATTKPELAKEYVDRNSKKKKTQILATSRMTARWKCPTCGGEYSAIVGDREVGDNACPYCRELRVLPGFSDLATKKPELAKEWSPNNDTDAGHILYKKHIDALWICPDCGGEYIYNLKYREVGDGTCPYCDNRKPLPGFNDLTTTNPELAAEWSPSNSRPADSVMKSFTRPVLWICPDCGGEYSASVCDREIGDDSCPYCAERKVLPGYNDLTITDPDLAAEYASENDLDATHVMKSMRRSAIWECPVCHGTYTERICDREVGDEACPYCSGSKLLPGFNDFKTLYPELAKEIVYDENELLLIDMDALKENDRRKIWWECQDCHNLYLMSPKDRLMKQKRGHTPCLHCIGRRRNRIHYF